MRNHHICRYVKCLRGLISVQTFLDFHGNFVQTYIINFGLRWQLNCEFQNIFNSYLNVPEDIKDYHEVSSKLKYSKLSVAIDKGASFPKRFGWLTEIGIYTGEVRVIVMISQDNIANKKYSFIRSTNKLSHHNSFDPKSWFHIQPTMKKTVSPAHRATHTMHRKFTNHPILYRLSSPNSMRSCCTQITLPYFRCSTIKSSTKSI